MPGSPFFFGDDGGDQMANSGTWLDLLRQKLPGVFDATAAGSPPMNASGASPSYAANAPVTPASSAGSPGAAPDVGKSATPGMDAFRAILTGGNKADKLGTLLTSGLPGAMTGQQPGPARPPLTTPTGQMQPGLNWKQALEVLGPAAAKGLMAGRAASENAVVQSGGRRSGGAGIGFEAGLEQPLIDASRQQQFQRGQLENQQLQQQAQLYPQTAALGIGKTISDIQKNTSDAALNAAKADAERYKPVGDVMYDMKAPGGPAPIQGSMAGQFVPATAAMAALAGIPVGSMIRTDSATKLQTLANNAPPSNADQINALHKAIYQTVFPGQELPDALTFKPGMTQEDYKRIDGGLNKLQTAQGTQAQRDVANGYRQTAQQIALGNQQERQQATLDREQKQGLQWVMWQDKDGRTVAGPLSLATQSGAQNPAALDTRDVQGAMDARQAVNLINKQGNAKDPTTWGVNQLIDSLAKDNKLGVASSRLNAFLAGQVGFTPGDDPRIISLLDKSQLLMTLSMKAHFGASGGRSPQMLDHFMSLANAKTMNAQTLRSGTAAVGDYMADRAMIPGGQGQGGQAQKAPTFADWKANQNQGKP